IETPLICVPFIDSKSLIRYPLGDLVSRACCGETVGWSMTMSFDGARPIVTASPINSCVSTSRPSKSRTRHAMFASDFDKQVSCCPVKTSDYLTIVRRNTLRFFPGQHEHGCSATLPLV